MDYRGLKRKRVVHVESSKEECAWAEQLEAVVEKQIPDVRD